MTSKQSRRKEDHPWSGSERGGPSKDALASNLLAAVAAGDGEACRALVAVGADPYHAPDAEEGSASGKSTRNAMAALLDVKQHSEGKRNSKLLSDLALLFADKWDGVSELVVPGDCVWGGLGTLAAKVLTQRGVVFDFQRKAALVLGEEKMACLSEEGENPLCKMLGTVLQSYVSRRDIERSEMEKICHLSAEKVGLLLELEPELLTVAVREKKVLGTAPSCVVGVCGAQPLPHWVVRNLLGVRPGGESMVFSGRPTPSSSSSLERMVEDMNSMARAVLSKFAEKGFDFDDRDEQGNSCVHACAEALLADSKTAEMILEHSSEGVSLPNYWGFDCVASRRRSLEKMRGQNKSANGVVMQNLLEDLTAKGSVLPSEGFEALVSNRRLLASPESGKSKPSAKRIGGI